MKLDWKTCFKVGVSIFVLYICIHYFPSVAKFISTLIGAAAPLLIGCVIAYLVNILMSLYERVYFPNAKNKILIKSRRPVCLTGALITLLGVISLVIGLVVPQFISCMELLISQVPDALDALIAELQTWEIMPDNILEYLGSINWEEKINQFGGILTSGVGSIFDFLVSAVSSVFSGIVTAILGIIFAIYLLISKEKIGRQCDKILNHYVKKKWYDKIKHVVNVMNTCFRKFIIGQCTEALILGVLCTLGMLILQIPYAAMIGALVALTALIPIAGAFIGAIVGALMILTVSPIKALIFLVFLIILQQLEENLIYPKVVGTSIGLPSIWVLAAITIGGGVMGILGMLIGVPLAATVYKLLKEDINKPHQIEKKRTRKKVVKEDNQL